MIDRTESSTSGPGASWPPSRTARCRATERAELEARLAALADAAGGLRAPALGGAPRSGGLDLQAPEVPQAPHRGGAPQSRLAAARAADASPSAARWPAPRPRSCSLCCSSSSGGSESPTVVEAARLAERPPRAPRSRSNASNPKLLAASVEGVPFPNWSKEFGWRQAGDALGPAGRSRGPDRALRAATGSESRYTIVVRRRDRARRAGAQPTRRKRRQPARAQRPGPPGRHLVARRPDLRALGVGVSAIASCSSSRPGRATGRCRSDRTRRPRGGAPAGPGGRRGPHRQAVSGGVRDVRLPRPRGGPGPGDLRQGPLPSSTPAARRRPRLPRSRPCGTPGTAICATSAPAAPRPIRGEHVARRAGGADLRGRPGVLARGQRGARCPGSGSRIPYREAVAAVDVAGLSYAEAARALGVRQGHDHEPRLSGARAGCSGGGGGLTPSPPSDRPPPARRYRDPPR